MDLLHEINDSIADIITIEAVEDQGTWHWCPVGSQGTQCEDSWASYYSPSALKDHCLGCQALHAVSVGQVTSSKAPDFKILASSLLAAFSK